VFTITLRRQLSAKYEYKSYVYRCVYKRVCVDKYVVGKYYTVAAVINFIYIYINNGTTIIIKTVKKKKEKRENVIEKQLSRYAHTHRSAVYFHLRRDFYFQFDHTPFISHTHTITLHRRRQREIYGKFARPSFALFSRRVYTVPCIVIAFSRSSVFPRDLRADGAKKNNDLAAAAAVCANRLHGRSDSPWTIEKCGSRTRRSIGVNRRSRTAVCVYIHLASLSRTCSRRDEDARFVFSLFTCTRTSRATDCFSNIFQRRETRPARSSTRASLVVAFNADATLVRTRERPNDNSQTVRHRTVSPYAGRRLPSRDYHDCIAPSEPPGTKLSTANAADKRRIENETAA